MFRIVVIASLAVALAAPTASAQSTLLESQTLLALVNQPVVEAASLVPIAFAVEVRAELPAEVDRAPWWATTIAVAGPIADGLSTMYALRQSGPSESVREGNGFYQRLFGSDVTAGEIMGFKVGQAAVMGLATHFAPKKVRSTVLLNVIASGAIHAVVSTMNFRLGAKARRANAAVSPTP